MRTHNTKEAGASSLSAIMALVMSAYDLGSETFEAPIEYIKGWLTPGTTLIAAKPKVGKSWLVLDWLYSIATGRPACGSIPTVQNHVLYIDLEIPARFLQARLCKVAAGTDMPKNLNLVTVWPRGEKGRRWLDLYLEAHPECKVVAIDIFGLVRDDSKKTGDLYQDDYKDAIPWVQVAAKHDVALILVTHKRKAGGTDETDTIMGSSGVAGACDSIITLTATNDDRTAATMVLTGRHLPPAEARLTFGEDCVWVAAPDPEPPSGTYKTKMEERAARDVYIIELYLTGKYDYAEIAEKVGLKSKSAISDVINKWKKAKGDA